MDHLKYVCLGLACFVPTISHAIPITEQVVSNISQGHRQLAQDVSQLTGEIGRFRGPLVDTGNQFSLDGMRQQMVATFYVSGESFRLDYLPLAQNVKKSVTEVLLKTQDSAFRYIATSTTGTPYATLFHYQDPKALEVQSRINVDLIYPLHFLFALPDQNLLDILQYPNVQLRETARDGEKHLTIFGSKKEVGGSTSEFEFSLDPGRHYALRSYKIVMNGAGRRISTEGAVKIADLAASTFVPHLVLINVSTGDESGSYRQIYQITASTTPANAKVFSPRSFSALRRDYTEVTVAPNGSTQTGKIVYSAPASDRRKGGGDAIRPKTSTKFWLIINGLIFFFLFVFFLLRKLVKPFGADK